MRPTPERALQVQRELRAENSELRRRIVLLEEINDNQHRLLRRVQRHNPQLLATLMGEPEQEFHERP